MMGCGDPTWRLKLARPLILFKREEAIVASNDFYASLPVEAYDGFHHFPTQFAASQRKICSGLSDLPVGSGLEVIAITVTAIYDDRAF